MLKRILTLTFFAAIFSAGAIAQTGQGALQGKVLDSETGEPLPFVNIVVELNGVMQAGGVSDIDGKYVIKPIPPGKYTVKATSVGYQPLQINGVEIISEKTRFLDIKMASTSVTMEEFVVVDYKVPVFEKDNTTTSKTVTSEDLLKMAARSAADVAKTAGGVYSQDDGSGSLNIRGSRSDANYYYIDGIKVTGSSGLPKSSIEQISVITGGLPAMYGDVTGGVISITTRGPSRHYFGSLEYSTSGYKIGDKVYGLDAFGYNLIEGSVSGPILMKKDSTGKKTEPILGFFVSGNYTDVVDAAPSAIGMWKVNDDVLDELKNNPISIRPDFAGTIQNAELLRLNSFEKIKTKQNVRSRGVQLNGKLDFNTGKTTNLTFGGSYVSNVRNQYIYSYSLYNYEHNPQIKSNSWRVFGRFTQRFINKEPGPDGKASALQNAYYTVQVDYNQDNFRRGPEGFGTNFWDYGYVGEFKRFQERQYEVRLDTIFYGSPDNYTIEIANFQTVFADTLIGFTPGTINPEMAAFTQSYYDIFGWQGYDENGIPIYDRDAASKDDNQDGALTGDEINFYLRNYSNIRSNGGYLNGDEPRSVYGLWSSQAAIFNSYIRSRTEQIRVSIMGSADIKSHALSIGFEFEQRTLRNYSINPRGLWLIGEQRTNSHITNLDKLNPIITQDQTIKTVSYERLNASPGDYLGEVGQDVQSYFDYNLRKSLGLNPDGNDFIDFHSLSPDQLDISFFSPNELFNSGNNLVDYFGYDAYGNVQKGNTTLNDFFNATNADGVYTRPIAAFRPNYIAGWIQDKFAFDDLIFNVGLRVDRLDLNQEVLIDQYVLFPTVKAGEQEARELANNMEGNYTIPGNIGEDYVVYVDNVQNPTRIVGYRKDDTWYNSEGIEISDSDVLKGSTGISPLLVDKVNTRSTDLTVASFTDYKPQVNIMPRIAFSFPISDEAVFFAHYDILTKRPTANGASTAARLSILDYYYMDQRTSSNIINNPNLKPEKTIDYSVGFKQKVTNSSSISLEAFYREMRDQIQLIGLKNAYPRTYTSFANIDFGTVKGITIGYDMRRTKNIMLNFAYTLQFADGTGSTASSAANLIRAGKQNLRSTTPLAYDQRHTIVATVDYRYGFGKSYNGPISKNGNQILAGWGLNLQFNVGSGTPYSRQLYPTGQGFIVPVGSPILDGSINGSRYPWQFRIDMRFDKDILLKRGEGKKPLTLNLYLQVFNVLNSLNIRSVYRYTGTPDDDGFLTAPQYQAVISSQYDEQSFREQYSMKINNPSNYNLPRRARIGALLIF